MSDSRRSSSRRRAAAQEKGCCGKCWDSWTKKYNHFANKTLFGRALTAEWGAFFNFVVANVIFWPIGFTTYLDHKYDNDDLGSDGQIASGSKGSGEFVITIVLFIIATFIFFYKIIRNLVQIRADDKAQAIVDAEAADVAAAEKKVRDAAKAARKADGGGFGAGAGAGAGGTVGEYKA